MDHDRVAIISAARTAIGTFGGSLKGVSAIDLGIVAAKEAIRRSRITSQDIQRVVAGQNIQVTPRGNPARPVLLGAGIPVASDDYSINMNCSSGLRAMSCLGQDLLLGDVRIGLAVGMENMSRTPYLLEGSRWGFRLGNAQATDFLADYILGDAGPMAENVAQKYNISRAAQDEFAYGSQMKAIAAIDAGRFKDDIVPVEIPQRKAPSLIFEVDEHPRRDTSREKLAKLAPAFKSGGSVTAGNSSGINDGAAAVVMTMESTAREMGLEPRAFLRSWAAAGVEPGLFGIGPGPATRKALAKAGISLQDVALIEVNEALASSTIAVIQDLELNPEKVNVNGGAIALGHPVGATGLIMLIKLLGELERRKARYGLVTMCVGNGQGMTVVIERE